LAGWSSGAVTAYEMARQAEAMGGRSLVTMFDPPPAERSGDDDGDDTALLIAFTTIWRLSVEQKAMLREMLKELDLETGLDRLHELARAAGILPPGVGRPWLAERFEVFRRNAEISESYSPRPYGGPVTLFRAGALLAPGAADLKWGWDRLARVDAHLIPEADHFSLLQEPALDQMVEHLENAFAAVEDERQRWSGFKTHNT
jgi:thioesterase domain-containing protein